MKLSQMKNIGTVIENQLIAVGISTPDELRSMGTEKAFLLLKAYDTTSCMHKLLAVEGAIENIKKSEISQMRKDELKAFFKDISK